MPYTFNGIGTMYYGKDEYEEDGSYITTEWSTIFWIPIYPVRSLRVKYIGEGETGLFTFSSSRYEVQPVPLYKKHVKKYYGMILSVILFLVFIKLMSFIW